MRGQRDGATVTANRVRNRGRRRLVGALAATVIMVGVLFVAVFPLQTYRTQRAATVKAESELRDVRKERARVKRETELLLTDGEIERQARGKFGFQRPGEETYNILPAPTDPIGLPETWPFTGLERALGG
ncbi:MAG: septum formation initiator family protein [Acidimicrobiia bacterium]|nr:septum formation initiator family protein [Acidimicrobiia bacterium]